MLFVFGVHVAFVRPFLRVLALPKRLAWRARAYGTAATSLWAMRGRPRSISWSVDAAVGHADLGDAIRDNNGMLPEWTLSFMIVL